MREKSPIDRRVCMGPPCGLPPGERQALASPVGGGASNVVMTDLRQTPPPVPGGAGALPPRLAMPVLLTATCLIVLDFFIVNVALPSLQHDLHAGPTAVEWVVAGYRLACPVLLLDGGRPGGRV